MLSQRLLREHYEQLAPEHRPYKPIALLLSGHGRKPVESREEKKQINQDAYANCAKSGRYGLLALHVV